MTETGTTAHPPSPNRPLRPVRRPLPAERLLRRAEEFVGQTARVLEQHRFAHHFLGAGAAGADAVERALAAYRTDDDGYGHALEPGLRGSRSAPAHAVHALRVLDSVGRCCGQRAERIGHYLTSVSAPDGALPVFPPRGPYGGLQGDLRLTAAAVGLLHRGGVWHPWLFRATDFCWHALDALRVPGPLGIEAAVGFLDAAPDRARAEAVAARLGRLVREQRLVADAGTGPQQPGPGAAASWRRRTPGEHRPPEEARLPHEYARAPHSLARTWFTDDEMARSLDLLAARQQPDGGWPVLPAGPGQLPGGERRWSPGAALEHLERRPLLTIEALRTLQAYGRLPD